MRWLSILLLLPAAHATADCVPGKVADWMVVGDPLAAAVRPADCLTVQQTPPDFGWPDISREARYTLHLSYPDGRTKSQATLQNWANWPEALPPGTYSWTVSATDARGTRRSSPRRFVVDGNAQPFVVPDMSALLAKVKARPHPRALPDSGTLDAMARQRAGALAALRGEVDRRLRNPLPPEPSSESVGANKSAVFAETKRTLDALVAYAFTREERYFGDALRRVKHLASWDPNGATAYHVKGMDMGARSMTWALTLGYDWLEPRLDAPTKAALQRTIQVRLGQMFDDTVGTRSRVARYPRDSHGQLTVAMLGVMSTLLAGEVARADEFAAQALPLGLNLTMPWGGEDGGFANGTPYALWDVGESLSYWYVLRWATGIDLAQKAWVRNFTQFLAYFDPPGTPARLFGDGHDRVLDEPQARFGQAFVHFAPTPLGRWYASQLSGADARRFEALMAPPADFSGAQRLPGGTPHALHVSSIGWVAMHSDLASTARTSVYFKSSPPPFGAFNHQHADQNAFVVNAGGERLAIESGYYDGYKTKHWREWLKTTQAKNAITYDGGKGQSFYEDEGRKMGYGRVTRFASTPDYDLVSGDATSAYGGALTQALRSLVYLRPNLILVHDRLASVTPREWEWNIHALNEMQARSARSIRIEHRGRSLCVDMLAGPPVRFSQHSEWVAAPERGEAQWHGRFSTAPLRAAEFIFLLNVGCEAASTAVSGRTVTLGRSTVTFEADQVVVRPSSDRTMRGGQG